MDCFGLGLSDHLSAAPLWESRRKTAEIGVAGGEHPALLGNRGNVSFSAAVDASLRLCCWHPKPNVSVVGVSLELRHCASVPWLPLSTSRGHMGVTQGCGVV